MSTSTEKCDRCDMSANSFGDGYKFCRAHYDEYWAERNARLAEETRKIGGPFPQRCPRRDEMFQQGGPPDETPDRWEYGRGLVTGDGLILTCSYWDWPLCERIDVVEERARSLLAGED